MSKNFRFPILNMFERLRVAPLNRSIAAFGAALAAFPALAAQDYPPGLFENSPVVGPPGATAPSGPPDATAPSQPPGADPEPPDAVAPLDEYCAGVASRTFRSLEEVKQAHARCDPGHGARPLPPPGDPGEE
jgi:hypothetical protein